MRNQIRIRRANDQDADSVRTLTRSAYAKWIPIIGREPRPMMADYDRAVREHLVDLLEVGGELAGLVEMIPESKSLLIENVAVAPGHQHKGYGRKLMSHAETTAATLGTAEIRLYTNKLFATNIKFYTRLGYTVNCEEPLGGSHVVYMSKSLSSD